MIDEVIKDGFDGVYLDWVEGYEDDAVIAEARRQGRNPAVEMIQFIEEIRDYATPRDPDFIIIQQNAAALSQGHPELFSVLDAISQEAIWYDGEAYDDWNAPDGYDVANDSSLTQYYLEYLDQYLEAGIPVLNCEYAVEYAADAFSKSYDRRYVPYCTRRALSRLTTTPPPEYTDDGAYQVDIPQSGSLQNPAWSPDGQSILFTRFRNGYNKEPADLSIIDLESTSMRTLVSDGSGNVNLPGSSWNSATHEIVFSSSREPHDEIFVIDENGNPGDETKITERENEVA